MRRPMQLNHYLGVFSPEELDRITELGDSLDLVEGAVLVKGKDSIEHKICQVLTNSARICLSITQWTPLDLFRLRSWAYFPVGPFCDEVTFQ